MLWEEITTINMSLPKQLSFPKVKSASVASVATSYRVTPSNSATNYSASSIMRFDIPTGIRGQWLNPNDTFLYFTVTPTLTGGTAPLWESLGPNFIDSIALYSSAGGYQIEQLSNYNALFHCLRDVTSDLANAYGSDTIMYGNNGLTATRTSLGTASGTARTYAIPLLSIIGLISAGDAGVMLPLHALSSPLRIEITLASAASALCCSGTPTAVSYIVTDPAINLSLVTVSDVAMAQIHQMTQGNYTWSSTTWRNFRNTHAANQMSDSILIPGRFSSAKSIVVVQRESAILEALVAFSAADRIKNGLSTYQFKIGSAYANAQPVPIGPQSYLEAMRCWGSTTTLNLPGLITYADYVRESSTVVSVGANPSSFLIALNLEPFNGATSALVNGVNSQGLNIFLDLVYSAAPVACTFDAYVEADAVCSISNGEMKISF
jgi:hypothetical protein